MTLLVLLLFPAVFVGIVRWLLLLYDLFNCYWRYCCYSVFLQYCWWRIQAIRWCWWHWYWYCGDIVIHWYLFDTLVVLLLTDYLLYVHFPQFGIGDYLRFTIADGICYCPTRWSIPTLLFGVEFYDSRYSVTMPVVVIRLLIVPICPDCCYIVDCCDSRCVYCCPILRRCYAPVVDVLMMLVIYRCCWRCLADLIYIPRCYSICSVLLRYGIYIPHCVRGDVSVVMTPTVVFHTIHYDILRYYRGVLACLRFHLRFALRLPLFDSFRWPPDIDVTGTDSRWFLPLILADSPTLGCSVVIVRWCCPIGWILTKRLRPTVMPATPYGGGYSIYPITILLLLSVLVVVRWFVGDLLALHLLLRWFRYGATSRIDVTFDSAALGYDTHLLFTYHLFSCCCWCDVHHTTPRSTALHSHYTHIPTLHVPLRLRGHHTRDCCCRSPLHSLLRSLISLPVVYLFTAFGADFTFTTYVDYVAVRWSLILILTVYLPRTLRFDPGRWTCSSHSSPTYYIVTLMALLLTLFPLVIPRWPDLRWNLIFVVTVDSLRCWLLLFGRLRWFDLLVPGIDGDLLSEICSPVDYTLPLRFVLPHVTGRWPIRHSTVTDDLYYDDTWLPCCWLILNYCGIVPSPIMPIHS